MLTFILHINISYVIIQTNVNIKRIMQLSDQFIKELIRYVQETLAISLNVEPWDAASGLPFFLKERYVFYSTRFMKRACILMVAKNQQEETPVTIRKHIDLLYPKSGDAEVIYVQRHLRPFNRRRFIEQKISFIIPGNQLYLLPLGVDFRERFKRTSVQPKICSPSAQLVILHALLKVPEVGIIRLADLSVQYGYSLMTVSRAFSEIESLGLGKVSMRKRMREMILKGAKRKVWDDALQYLRNPVIRRFYLDQTDSVSGALRAGLSALASYSMLAEPENKILAVSSASGTSLLRQYGKDKLLSADQHALEIEVWSYDPSYFATEGVVDRLSLYLSLRDNKDERIEAALDDMMKGIAW